MLIIPQIINEKVLLYAGSENWMESKAIEQLKTTAKLPGVIHAAGMPDLHPGRGIPIGAGIITEKVIYPYLVGNDIGCGMGLWQSSIAWRKSKVDKWLKKLSIDLPWQGDREAFVEQWDLPRWDDALGTIGGGNHFAELQRVEKIIDEKIAEEIGLDKNFLQLMVHSGSRGLGSAVLSDHLRRHGNQGLVADSEDGRHYLQRHDHALQFARANRALIAERFLQGIGSKGTQLCDMMHNLVTPIGNDQWLHRKGAAPADQNIVLIPGSRGSFSYIVRPLKSEWDHAFSLAHGAGRRWDRNSTRARLGDRFRAAQLEKTALGSRVLCKDKDLLFEEAPQAYKDIEVVIEDLKTAGLITVIAQMRPVLTYKTDGGRNKCC